LSYAIDGKPPEGDCKPPQAAAAVEASARDTSGLTFDSSHWNEQS